ncbi:MAG: GldG family protein [Spirochaetaceae bacterium]|jgi:ABC-type uncharacterized transport system involved in gliding motility auxiliary subunit|nr:GldG family protein [Spirochaetaceae bacterium]
MTKKQETTITLLAVGALALALGVCNRLWLRLDMTAAHAYTIAPVSRQLWTALPDQVQITYYVSDKLRAIHPIPGEIIDLLREYAAYSKGKIRVLVRDPVKENRVQAVEQLGIAPQSIQTVERDEATFATVYTGITIEYLGELAVLPVVFSLTTLEYDLTSRIRALVQEKSREMTVLVADAGKSWQNDYAYLAQALLGAGYQVQQAAAGETITGSALLVLGGVEALDDWALYRIDHYIQSGGKVFFAAEGVFVNTSGSLEARPLSDSGLLAMLSGYGAQIEPALVLDRSANMVQYQMGAQYRLARYPLWVAVLEENGNKEHPLTARFSGIDLFWASPLTLKAPTGVEAVPLFSSTPSAWLQSADFSTNPEGGALLEREASETTGTKILAASLSGAFPSYFNGKAKPTREGSSEQLPDMPTQALPARLIVVGDSDIGSLFIQSQRNLDFLVQALDWLRQDDDIIGIRNRQPGTGRLDTITDIGRRLAVMNSAKLVNLFLVPVLIIVLGIVRHRRRHSGTGAL